MLLLQSLFLLPLQLQPLRLQPLLLLPLLLQPLLENGTTCDKISLAATPPPPKATPILLVF